MLPPAAAAAGGGSSSAAALEAPRARLERPPSAGGSGGGASASASGTFFLCEPVRLADGMLQNRKVLAACSHRAEYGDEQEASGGASGHESARGQRGQNCCCTPQRKPSLLHEQQLEWTKKYGKQLMTGGTSHEPSERREC